MGRHKRQPVDMSWHQYAACRGVDTSWRGADTVWFFVPYGTYAKPRIAPEVQRAIARYCGGCPVRLLCWEQAAGDRYAEGVYGGEYWGPPGPERRAMERRGPLAIKHGP